jgi:hypothetical protein
MRAPTRRNVDLRKALRAQAPDIPLADAEDVLAAATRATRTGLPASVAVWLALVAHVRHRHTAYDTLLAEGYDRDSARHFVVAETEEQLSRWGCRRRLGTDGEESED